MGFYIILYQYFGMLKKDSHFDKISISHVLFVLVLTNIVMYNLYHTAHWTILILYTILLIPMIYLHTVHYIYTLYHIYIYIHLFKIRLYMIIILRFPILDGCHNPFLSPCESGDEDPHFFFSCKLSDWHSSAIDQTSQRLIILVDYL